MNAGSEILGYEVLATLGYGARSTIFAVKDEDNQIYALKRVVKNSAADERYLSQAIHEHEIAGNLDHPTLRKSYKLIRQRALLRTTEVFVLMEMVDGLTLEQHQPANMLELCRLCQQVAEGLHSMHQAGFVHADIKPNNILVGNHNSVKVIDFGQSCPVGTVKERIQGTPDFIAPEQVMRWKILPQTDVFNFGATLYWLLTNRHVPTMMSKGQLNLSLRSRDGMKSPRILNPQVPPALSQLVMECLQIEVNSRPTSMQEIRDRLIMSVQQINHNQPVNRPAHAPAELNNEPS